MLPKRSSSRGGRSTQGASLPSKVVHPVICFIMPSFAPRSLDFGCCELSLPFGFVVSDNSHGPQSVFDFTPKPSSLSFLFGFCQFLRFHRCQGSQTKSAPGTATSHFGRSAIDRSPVVTMTVRVRTFGRIVILLGVCTPTILSTPTVVSIVGAIWISILVVVPATPIVSNISWIEDLKRPVPVHRAENAGNTSTADKSNHTDTFSNGCQQEYFVCNENSLINLSFRLSKATVSRIAVANKVRLDDRLDTDCTNTTCCHQQRTGM